MERAQIVPPSPISAGPPLQPRSMALLPERASLRFDLHHGCSNRSWRNFTEPTGVWPLQWFPTRADLTHNTKVREVPHEANFDL